MPKVLIAPQTLAGIDGQFLKVLREAGFEVVYPPSPTQLTEEELLRNLKGVCASIAGSEPYNQRVISANPALRVVARAGVGYDAVDLVASSQHGVAVTITPNTNQGSVAEHTFALMLGLAKDLVPQHVAVQKGGWPRKANLPLRGRTIGLLGLGRIGKAVAERAAVFGMNLIAYEPYPDKRFVEQYKITLVPFEKVMSDADFVSVHVPLTAESKYLICKKTLALMKPTAFLINTARGGLVCEADLVDALKQGKIAGAGLDVFETEPTLPNNPLFAFDNVLLTPHAAGVDLQSRDDMALSAAEAIVAISRGEWPEEKVVNPDVRAKFRW